MNEKIIREQKEAVKNRKRHTCMTLPFEQHYNSIYLNTVKEIIRKYRNIIQWMENCFYLSIKYLREAKIYFIQTTSNHSYPPLVWGKHFDETGRHKGGHIHTYTPFEIIRCT